MKPTSSLFAKIISWFLLNMVLVAVALAMFFAFQPQVNLHALFGQQGSLRLQSAGMLITHDLNQVPQSKWSDVLARHAEIHRVDFVIVFENGSHFSSTEDDLPETVVARARRVLRLKPPRDLLPPPPRLERSQQLSEKPEAPITGDMLHNRVKGRKPSRHIDEHDRKPHVMMRTQQPTRYWSGIRVPLFSGSLHDPAPALLLAMSSSVTGHGFFFDPIPWMVVAAAVIVISVLLWIPMVRNITRPLARMTRTTEEIAQGCFDISINEPRADEIGRLARAINHMTTRLSALVKGQKRFLGDVAHELGAPIARIQFGLAALEHRVKKETRQRVIDVMEDVEHMSKLVNELLAFSRADIKSNTVKLERIALLPVVQTAVKREETPEAEIIILIDPQICVVASQDLLTRAFANLVRNATKYAGEVGPIYISAEKSNNVVEIKVRDNGPGVPEDLLDQLFEPFFRPEPSRDRDSGGVGLGLAIVKTCVQACSGTVSAANLKPNGFAVTITLKM